MLSSRKLTSSRNGNIEEQGSCLVDKEWKHVLSIKRICEGKKNLILLNNEATLFSCLILDMSCPSQVSQGSGAVFFMSKNICRMAGHSVPLANKFLTSSTHFSVHFTIKVKKLSCLKFLKNDLVFGRWAIRKGLIFRL